jgi:hypothetical protein
LQNNIPGFAAMDPREPVKLSIEARDFGIYAGFLATWAYLAILGRGRASGVPSASILLALVLFVFAMGADGLNAFFYDTSFFQMPIELPHLYTPSLQLRLGTGLLCGIAFAGILLPVVNSTLWRDQDTRPIIGNWKQFLGGISILAILFLLNESESGIFLYPFSILAAASVVILIALINMVFVISFFKRPNAITLRDALNPFAAGVFLTLIELALLSAARYAILGTATLP